MVLFFSLRKMFFFMVVNFFCNFFFITQNDHNGLKIAHFLTPKHEKMMYNLLFSCNNKDSKIYNKNKYIKIDIVTRGTTVTEVFQKNQVLVTLELALFLTIPYLEYME
jgi:hypothetical protein